MPAGKGKRKGEMPDAEPLDLLGTFGVFFLTISVAFVIFCAFGMDSSSVEHIANLTHLNSSAVGARVAGGFRYARSLLNETMAKIGGGNVTDRAVRRLWTTLESGSSLWDVAAVRHAVLSAVCGGLLTVYGWYVLYWDSFIPGSFPRSPRWPWKYSSDEGHSLTLNQIMVLLMGPIAAVRMYRELHGGWYVW